MLTFDDSFYLEEERCGYTVSTEMKQVWAVQLDLLDRFQTMCREHHLRYFASGGTLLGAVRHGGYIPWDDDIDLMMFRDEYERMLTVAADYFEPPYFFQTVDTDRRYSRGHAQLRHSNTAAILKGEGAAFPFNQGIFIDIFPVDAVPDDDALRRRQQRTIRCWERLLNAGVRYPANPRKTPLKNILHAAVSLIPYRWIFRRMEAAARRYNHTDTERIGMLTFMPENERLHFCTEDFDAVRSVPFEHTTIDIPAGYDRVLRDQYGDYTVPVQAPSYHGTVTFDVKRSYMDYIK